jgi:hypothetical protein
MEELKLKPLDCFQYNLAIPSRRKRKGRKTMNDFTFESLSQRRHSSGRAVNKKQESEILDMILDNGFLTGSRAFMTHNEDSDYDIVIPIFRKESLCKLLEGLDIIPSEYFSGFFVTPYEKTINIIPVHYLDYLPWYLTTKAFKTTWKRTGIQDPLKKYAVFQGTLALYKAVLPVMPLHEFWKMERLILRGAY